MTAVSDKTFIGRTERGFDFLGYHFGPEGLAMASKTIEQFVERALRLYEQEPGVLSSSSQFGRYEIRLKKALEEAIRTINYDLDVEEAIRADQDTEGV